MKATAAFAGATALAGGVQPQMKALAVDFSDKPDSDAEQVFTVSCRSNCFQGCMLKAHVRDGFVRKITPAPYPEEDYTGCCLRGLTLHERTYSATRIQYPMKRAGERGEDKWERITWDEALDEVASKFKEIQEQYGKGAVAVEAASGNQGTIHAAKGILTRFCNAIACTKIASCYDMAYGYGTNRVVGGGVYGMASEIKGVKDAKTVLIWGANPTNSSPQNWRFIQKAKEQGTKLIAIDPMFSGTAAKCDEWVPIKPGTDLHLAMALINIVLSEGLYDEEFVKAKTTAPFLIREDTGALMRTDAANAAIAAATTASPARNVPGYVWDADSDSAGQSDSVGNPALEGEYVVDGVACKTVFSALKEAVSAYTAEYAEEMTGIPADKVRELAGIYANEGPVFLYTVYAIDHYQTGHLYGQAMAILHSITGNIGVPGTSLGGFWYWAGNFNMGAVTQAPTTAYGALPMSAVAECIRTGKTAGKDYPLKAMLVACANPVSNYAEQNDWFDTILPGLDLLVTMDTEFTDTARYSDIVLPVSFWLEVDDVRANFCNPFVVLNEKAIEPLYETKPDAEIFALIAEKMGVGELVPNVDAKEWIQAFMTSDKLAAQGIDYDRLVEEKAIRSIGSEEEPFVFCGTGFGTTSGRAELYVEKIAPRVNYGQDFAEAAAKEHFPYARDPHEASERNELFAKYPLVLTTGHFRWRSHTQWFAVQYLKELESEPLIYLGPEDAKTRGIETGDVVKVFNDRGFFKIKAVVSDALTPGYINMPKGWQRNQFIEGCYQEVSSASTDCLAVNYTFFDTLVDVVKEGR